MRQIAKKIPRERGSHAVLTATIAAFACVGLFGEATAAGAKPSNAGYRSVSQDVSDMKALCGAGKAQDLVVIVTVRGSGELPLGGQLSKQYYPALARELVNRGYRVSGYEVAYEALGTEAILGRIPEYVRSAVGSGPKVARQLTALVRRCASRKVVVGAYSQGAITLRSAFVDLAPRTDIWRGFAQIDLFGDGSASREADAGMPNGPTPLIKFPARRATMGVWLYSRNATAAARTDLAKAVAVIFRADNLEAIASLKVPTSYPTALKPRVDRYCMVEDIVCDTKAAVNGFVTRAQDIGCTLGAIGVTACATESGWFTSYLSYTLGQHTAYHWRAAALETARSFPRLAIPGFVTSKCTAFRPDRRYGDIVERILAHGIACNAAKAKLRVFYNYNRDGGKYAPIRIGGYSCRQNWQPGKRGLIADGVCVMGSRSLHWGFVTYTG